jgi:hypothetical protein
VLLLNRVCTLLTTSTFRITHGLGTFFRTGSLTHFPPRPTHLSIITHAHAPLAMIGITSPAQTAAIMDQMRVICSHFPEMYDQWLEYVKILREILEGECEDIDAGYDWLYCNLPLLSALQEFHQILMQELTEDRSNWQTVAKLSWMVSNMN